VVLSTASRSLFSFHIHLIKCSGEKISQGVAPDGRAVCEHGNYNPFI
jgi:hypothetical protein